MSRHRGDGLWQNPWTQVLTRDIEEEYSALLSSRVHEIAEKGDSGFIYMNPCISLKKRLLFYLILWFPAFLISFFTDTPALFVLKWVFIFIMLAGWCVNTAAIARQHWRGTLAGILFYFGANTLIIVGLYMNVYDTINIDYQVLKLAGMFSFTPASVIAYHLFKPDAPQELFVTVLIFAVLMVGWIIGAILALRKRSHQLFIR